MVWIARRAISSEPSSFTVMSTSMSAGVSSSSAPQCPTAALLTTTSTGPSAGFGGSEELLDRLGVGDVEPVGEARAARVLDERHGVRQHVDPSPTDGHRPPKGGELRRDRLPDARPRAVTTATRAAVRSSSLVVLIGPPLLLPRRGRPVRCSVHGTGKSHSLRSLGGAPGRDRGRSPSRRGRRAVKGDRT